MLSLKAGIEDLKQAKTLMSEANHIMSDHISKLKALEEENAKLKGKLELMECVQGPSGYMELPLDADGVPIHLGDTVWYIGVDVGIAKDYPLKVDGFVMEPFDFGIFIETQEFQHKAIAPESLTHEQLEPADSWEKLEEDAMKWSCSYFGIDQDAASCDDCPHGLKQTGNACWLNARLDMLARAKKLAGIEEEAR